MASILFNVGSVVTSCTGLSGRAYLRDRAINAEREVLGWMGLSVVAFLNAAFGVYVC